MRDALAATGRPIVYSINPNSIHEKTGPLRNWGDVANMWRTTEDITNAWDTGQTNGYPMGIQNIVNVTVPLAAYAQPGRLQRPGHDGGRPRRDDRHRDAQPLRAVGDHGVTADRRQRPPVDVDGDARPS